MGIICVLTKFCSGHLIENHLIEHTFASMLSVHVINRIKVCIIGVSGLTLIKLWCRKPSLVSSKVTVLKTTHVR